MAKQWIFALYASSFFLHVRADDLSDFSNNLATDIGPLLVLFGESMTKQYLSESTSFLDYFIFAMAPIGILTAIISAIRVCGHSSLRAFIGRSQEGEGAIEAELCTSTSRDVCELFNRGGITRVLGKPDILELIYDPGTHSIKPLQEYLRNREDKENSWWQKYDSPSLFPKPKPRDGEQVLFAPNPNLSLNVGIVKPPDWVLYVVAAAGLVLQTGVLSLAGVGVWILGWNLSGSESSASKNYAPVMFITGTVVMCGGMWSCAALIGQTTHEVRFRRTEKPEGDAAKLPRLLWLQPGPQVIGDQSFDPFAYLEDTAANPLQTWTSSRKDFEEKFETYTFFAVLAVLLGYITQFIGLRGMKGWVSLAQLGITLIMSVLRGCLRMQRLGRNDNLLLTMPDMVSGYELDWLSFEIITDKKNGGQDKGARSFHVTGHVGDAQTSESKKTQTSDSKNTQTSDQKQIKVRVGVELIPKDGLENGLDCTSLLKVRWKLAVLTGNTIDEGSNPRKSFNQPVIQNWRDTRVKVRSKAVELCNAICQAAEDLWKKRHWKHQSKETTTLQAPAIIDDRLIDIALFQPSDESGPGWRMDTAQVEAILGLWMWTLASDERVVRYPDDSQQKESRAEEPQCMRIVSAGLDDDNWGRGFDKQAEMDLWLGSNAVTLLKSTFPLTKQSWNGITTLWDVDNKGDCEPTRSDSQPEGTMGRRRRFCGWHSLQGRPELTQHLASGSGQQGSQPARVRVQIVPTQGSLLDLCARELFSSMMLSLMGTLNVQSTTVLEDTGLIRLENLTVATFAKAFTECGLGLFSEALLCLVPGFRTKYPLPSPEDMLSALLRAAEAYRKRSEWERAQTLLRWACEQHAPGRGGLAGEGAAIPDSAGSFFTRALRAIGELYRWSLAAEHSSDERKDFARSGIEWMGNTYRYVGQSDPDVSEILNCYEVIAQRIAPVSADNNLTPTVLQLQEVAGHFILAMKNKNRTDALHYLCLVKTGDFGSQALQPVLPLAVRNDWNEVVEAALEMKAGLNSQDEDQRTALWYAAQSGRESYLRLLINHGAFSDQTDDKKQTPLLIASSKGHEVVVQHLLETGHVNIEATDENGDTALFRAAENGYETVVKLLVDNGAAIDFKDKHRDTAVWRAAQNGQEAVVKLLIEKGADIRWNRYRGRLLSWATANGLEALAKLLIEKGVYIESNENGCTPLSLAAGNGHEAVVKLLVEKGASMDSNENAWTPLSLAAGRGHEAVVKLLMEKGASMDPNEDGVTTCTGVWVQTVWQYAYWVLTEGSKVVTSVSDNGSTPLSLAAGNGHEAVVKLLVEKGASMDPNEDGSTPLSLAAGNGHEAVVKLLVEKGASIDSNENARTPLSWAAGRGHEAVVELLMEKGASMDSNEDGSTPLSLAAQNGHETVVKLLVERGADIESKDKNGETPLLWAAKNGHEGVVKLLIERGADIESKDENGLTPLSWAAKEGNEIVVKLLIEKGTDIESKDKNGQTTLSWAARHGRKPVVKLLIERGADIKSKDENDQTPLLWAAAKGCEAVVKLLIEQGADIESKDKNGQTPLLWAAAKGCEAVVKLLIEKGADIESQDKNGQTPLLWAAASGCEAVVKLLIEQGADIESKDKNGQTPLSWAAKEGNEAVVELLIEKGASIDLNEDCWALLSSSIESGHEAVVKLLVEKGADIKSKDKDGETSL
ncbi:ankyrin repeat-containing domain protein [Cladorrhinum sp. PSN332]|nr:ankyrin repeat-containing domain protein [Cladorrhinum sp. PSN332]